MLSETAPSYKQWAFVIGSNADENMVRPVQEAMRCRLHPMVDLRPPVDLSLSGVDYAVSAASRFATFLNGWSNTVPLAGVVLAGDRLETLMVAGMARQAGLRIAHIGGGETRPGAYAAGEDMPDNQYRWCITDMASLHFVAAHSAEMLRCRTAAGKVFATGLPSVDDLEERARRQGTAIVGKPMPDVLVCLHPVPGNYETFRRELEYPELIANALNRRSKAHSVLRVLWCLPGPDRGREELTEACLSAFSKCGPLGDIEVEFVERTPHFLAMLKHARLAIGNSSSFVIEAGVFGTPTILIGERNKWRYGTKYALCAGTYRRAGTGELLMELPHLKQFFIHGSHIAALDDIALISLVEKAMALNRAQCITPPELGWGCPIHGITSAKLIAERLEVEGEVNA